MVKNIQNISRIPYNRPLYEVSFKSRYNLYTPLATDDIPGIAAFNKEHFNILDGIVSLKNEHIRVEDYSKWKENYTEGDELICPGSIKGITNDIGTPNILWQNGYEAFIAGDTPRRVPGLLLVLHDIRTDGTLIQKEIFYVGTSENISTDPYLPSKIYIKTVTLLADGRLAVGQFKSVMDMVKGLSFKSDYYDREDARYVGYSTAYINTTLNTLTQYFPEYISTRLAPIQEEIMTIDAKTAENNADIAIINGKIPSVATVSNQLADKAFVNSSINNMASFYITRDAVGNGFETREQLISTTTYYHGSEPRVPTQNDYAIVLQDETHENKTARYSYQGISGSGGEWTFQYVIASISDGGGGTSFTQEQLDAINSGITRQVILDLQTALTAANAEISRLNTELNNLASAFTDELESYWKKSDLTFNLQDTNLNINVK